MISRKTAFNFGMRYPYPDDFMKFGTQMAPIRQRRAE